MHTFTVPRELENRVEIAARSSRLSPAKWIESLVREELRNLEKPPANPHVRATAKPGGKPAQWVKPDEQHVLSTIATARESLRHANANHSQPSVAM